MQTNTQHFARAVGFVLLAILLISTVVVGLISGLFTSMIASADNQDARRAEAALVSYASSVKREPASRYLRMFACHYLGTQGVFGVSKTL